ncbi:putative osmoprotectant uptake system substrate-binding protein OsmF precursor [compost metagenome]
MLNEHPEIGPALDPVFATLNLTTLQQLNARIAVNGEEAGAVARGFLKSRRFLP